MMVERALEAAQELAPAIDVEVIDLGTIYPFDLDLINSSVNKTGKVIIAHEVVTRFGLGAELVRNIVENSFDYLDSSPKVLGNIGVPIPYSVPLEEAAVPQKEDIIIEVRKMFTD